VEEIKNPVQRKILVVEDNQDSRELVVKILKRKGYQIVEAADGEEAFAKAVSEKPHLILMDISLPKIDGAEVTKRLKKMEDFQDIPIVALTAHAMKGDREKMLETGFEGYISKPISVRDFPEQVRAFLRGKWESILGGPEE
jgi:two-component system cell cycle response regulator DivK